MEAQFERPSLARTGLAALACATAGLAACSGGGGGNTSQVGTPGSISMKPGSATPYIVDSNRGGSATRLRIAAMFWGRIVDVHGIDAATGDVDPIPVFEDYVVDENLQSDGANYLLETNAITQQTRLVVLRSFEDAREDFRQLLRAVSTNLAPVAPRADGPSAAQPVSFVARNSALVLRFDDALDDRDQPARDLANTIKVQTGYPPANPFETRIFFDRNHGVEIDGAFHSTRVVVDLTVSDAELADAVIPVGINSLGLPASLVTTGQPNVSVRIPSRVDPGSGQFTILTSVSGKPISTANDNGPVDFTSGSVDVVRGMRAGNNLDSNNGFLLDLDSPQVVGGWPVTLDQILTDPDGIPGFDFILRMTFTSVCRGQPREGDILEIGSGLLEVTRIAGAPNPDGEVSDVRIRVLNSEPAVGPASLMGTATFLTTFDPASPVQDACWFTFLPEPLVPPAQRVDPEAEVLVRFTEPMDPSSMRPFDSFMVVEGNQFDEPDASNTVVARVAPSSDLKEYCFRPVAPLAHLPGQEEMYHIDLVSGARGPTDLAGNSLVDELPAVEFTLDPAGNEARTGGIVLRFDRVNEFDVDDPDPVNGNVDVRGQFFYDFERGVIRPRDPMHTQEPHDRSHPVPGKMLPFAPGIQTPLAPLGSKLAAVWRYCDFGWLVTNESKYNLDVEGMYWSPTESSVIADSYPEFEIRLAHSKWLPDEYVDFYLLPNYQRSGLDELDNFDTYPLDDPLSPQTTVHNRMLGYIVDPSDLFINGNNTPLMPYPVNRTGGPYRTYTWRDTAALAVGGSFSAGVPLHVEVGTPLSLYGPTASPGQLYRTGNVPTIGLPLLAEIRCYPSDRGVGLNSFDISLAINSSAEPNFRAFSTGGIDENFNRVVVNPDDFRHRKPRGGYNPTSNPPGRPTRRRADNTFYIGALDVVIRISRVHTIWLNTRSVSPDFLPPVIEPRQEEQPDGAEVVVEFRGASSILAGAEEPFDAEGLDPYGEPWTEDGVVLFQGGVNTWSEDINSIDGAPYVQIRFSFVNNLETGLAPELSAIGVPYQSL